MSQTGNAYPDSAGRYTVSEHWIFTIVECRFLLFCDFWIHIWALKGREGSCCRRWLTFNCQAFLEETSNARVLQWWQQFCKKRQPWVGIHHVFYWDGTTLEGDTRIRASMLAWKELLGEPAFAGVWNNNLLDLRDMSAMVPWWVDVQGDASFRYQNTWVIYSFEYQQDYKETGTTLGINVNLKWIRSWHLLPSSWSWRRLLI